MWAVCEIIKRLSQSAINCYLRCYAFMGIYPKPLRGRSDVIVSLTSFPKRIDVVWMAIDSMFHQKQQPSRIYLYLTNEEFPGGREQIPKRLLNYEKLGLEICFREHNLKPHNKYFYALQEHYNKNVITIDDDIYYHDDTVKRLLEAHSIYPKFICANRIDIITFDNAGMFEKYQNWQKAKRKEMIKPSILNVALGFVGVLYPSGMFTNCSKLFDIELIKKLSLNADDLWLKAIESIENIQVIKTKYCCMGVSIGGSQSISLMSTNCHGENDIQWNRLVEEFNLIDIIKPDKE